MERTRATRGRPPLADPATVRSAAIELFRTHGYGAVSLSRIATELGLSVRTLHRYFPSKADILWGGTEGSLRRLRERLAELEPGQPPLLGLATAMAGVVDDVNRLDAVERARLHVIALNPELQRTRTEPYGGWDAETQRYLARRLGDRLSPEDRRSVSAAVQAAVRDSLYQWAQAGGHGDPARRVYAALAALALVAQARR